MLPDGQRVLFTVATDRPDVSQVAVLDLETGQRKTLIQGGSDARYVGSGHLVYVAGGTLRAVRLDPVTLEVLGDPVPVVDQVMTPPGGPGNFAVSKSGTLIHVLGGAEAQIWPSRSLVWVDRQGREEPIPAPPRAYASPRLSPDGTRIAVEVRAGEPAIWIWDLRRKTFQRLNADAFAEQNPVWTPDGRLVFASNRGGVPNVYRQASDGSAPAQALTSSTWGQYPFAVSRDASRVFLTQLSPLADIAVLVDGERRTELLIKRGNSPDISPSGQWLAYQSPFSVSSTEPGQSEIFVRPFPSVDRERVRVSPDGGSRPAWAPSGREMFYLDRRNRLTAVTVQTTGSTFTAGTPRTVLESEYFPDAGPAPGRPYDVSTNGRFLMIKENPMNDVRTPAASIIVVQNWFEELKRLVRGGIAPGRTR
jgi:hypothetical protein